MSSSNLFINLDALVELSNKLSTSRDFDFILNTSVLSLMGKLAFRRGVGLLFSLEENKTITLIIKGSFESDVLVDELKNNIFTQANGGKFIINFSKEEINVKIRIGTDKVGIIHLSSRIRNLDLTSEERHYLFLVCNLTANALEIAENYETIRKANFELQKRNQLLSTIFEMSKDFSLPLCKEEIVSQLKFILLGQLLTNKFAFFYKENGKIQILLNLFDHNFNLEQISQLFSLSSVIYLKDLESFQREKYNDLLGNDQTELLCPIMYHNSVRAILLLGKRYSNASYTPEDISFIEALGSTVIRAIENFRLIRQEIEKKQIEKELELALEIQRNLLPKQIPKISDTDIYGLSIPSRVVGGDYFDVIQLDSNSILVVIADVSGKGVPAALLMANLQSALKTLINLRLPISEIVNHLNLITFENTSPDIFITIFLGKYDASKKEFEYINAGHNPPLLYKSFKDDFYYLSKGGIFLGFSNNSINYEVGKVFLEKGDLILIYTDGVTEAYSTEMNEFGVERLKKFVKSVYSKSAKDICKHLVKEIYQYCNSTDLNDDLSLIVLKVK